MKTIHLTRGKVAIVDDDDYDRVSQYKWYATAGGKYAARADYANGRNHPRNVYMHRFIMNAPDGVDVDHINGDPFDNRKSNLRICTRAENLQNSRKKIRNGHSTSKYKGVNYDGREGKRSHVNKSKRWCAYIRLNGKKVHLGQHATEVEAAIAYDNAARAHFGPFAKLNFPEHQDYVQQSHTAKI
jgi:hypothetical protein